VKPQEGRNRVHEMKATNTPEGTHQICSVPQLNDSMNGPPLSIIAWEHPVVCLIHDTDEVTLVFLILRTYK
jgi:hypothetical protein